VSERSGDQSGRPPKLTPEIEKAICKQLELAVPEKYAAESNGVDESTFHDWMKKGAEGIKPYVDLYGAVKRARARAVGNLTARALAGGAGSSQATWFLERRYRKEYGPQVLVGGVADAAPISIQNELRVAESIRACPEATEKLHEAILLAAAADSKQRERSMRKH
jgi:hypothetical protein